METKHTPGPWKVSKKPTRFGTRYDIEGGCSAAGGLYVADMMISSSERPLDEVAANAHLVAAAPDLLEACKLLLIYLGDPDEQDVPEVKSARLAIAKAEGKGE